MRPRRFLHIGLILTFFWFQAPAAQAHAELVSSIPAVGAHLDAEPTHITVTFDGDLLTIGGSTTNVLVVKDPGGSQIDAKNSRVSGTSLSVDINPVTISGAFSVSWRVVSSDGHPEQGSYQFTVGTSLASPTPAQTDGETTSQYLPKVSGGDFWTRYGTRLLLVLVAALAIGVWVRFERARRKAG